MDGYAEEKGQLSDWSQIMVAIGFVQVLVFSMRQRV